MPNHSAVTPAVYKRHTERWFYNKRAVALRDLSCPDGRLIRTGEPVTIKRKWKGFVVRATGERAAWYVPVDAIALLSDP